jgi:hypothetical protein
VPLKSLVIKSDGSVENLLRIAHAEARKILKSQTEHIDIVDVILRPYGWVVVFSFGGSDVQGGFGQNNEVKHEV